MYVIPSTPGIVAAGVLKEEEFVKANEAFREEKKALETRQKELITWLEWEHTQASKVEQVPVRLMRLWKLLPTARSTHQKAQLQTILNTARVY